MARITRLTDFGKRKPKKTKKERENKRRRKFPTRRKTFGFFFFFFSVVLVGCSNLGSRKLQATWALVITMGSGVVI